MEETRENSGRAVGEDGRITALCQSLQPRDNEGAKMSSKILLLRATETQRGRAEMEEKMVGSHNGKTEEEEAHRAESAPLPPALLFRSPPRRDQPGTAAPAARKDIPWIFEGCPQIY
ncbi:unnamed protein product [Pleuronectes platessa]|uniref:Uncharacterized protein n=1 Tax=Pleuronectes platessa TaxID=8262 RepID=A0A9N7VFE2_PLEPL|nr:unnamed protein product [Pleuronectes platessa]